jgi:hypothetical protein
MTKRLPKPPFDTSEDWTFADDLHAKIEPLVRRHGVDRTAREAGIHQASLRSYLSKRRTLPANRLERIADVLGRTITVRLSKKQT